MINNLSQRIVERMLLNGTVQEDERELYVYGFFILLSQLMYFVLTCIAGTVLGCLIESIIFYIAFQFIRKYAGGYHASTEAKCEIMSSLSVMASLGVIRLSKAYDIQTALLILGAVSAVCIFSFCPLDTPEKPLSEKEYMYFRKISWLILFVIAAAIVFSVIFKLKFLLAPCCISLVLEGVLITLGRLKRQTAKSN